MTSRDWLRARAKALRAEMTPQEKAMWALLHQGELVALNWRRQAPFGDYVLDFVSHPARIVVEVDGAQHAEGERAAKDLARSAWLNAQGYQVLRFWNDDVVRARDGVWRTVYEASAATPAIARINRWRAREEAGIRATNARLASSSMEEAPRSGGGGARLVTTNEPPGAHSFRPLASPPQSALRADSSSIEEERS